MFKIKTKIKELEQKISQLQAQVDVLSRTVCATPTKPDNRLSYEEVIDLWLNGKEN